MVIKIQLFDKNGGYENTIIWTFVLMKILYRRLSAVGAGKIVIVPAPLIMTQEWKL